MDKKIIVNSSPLITLAKSNLLFLLLEGNHKLIIPKDVFNEVILKNKDDEIYSYRAELEKYKFSEYKIPNDVISWGLGIGESSVIATAISLPNSTVVIDDLEARKCARINGLSSIGTLGIVIAAKKEGKIESAKEAIKKLLFSGLYLDQKLIHKVLKESVNEDWEIF